MYRLLQILQVAILLLPARLLAQSSAPVIESPPRVAVVVVVDVSGSMHDGRLATAVTEIKAFAKQLPPGEGAFWHIIPFADHARPAQTFAGGYAELSEYLDSLQADGGTCIAEGLAEAVAIAGQYATVPDVVVMLYSDGEDNDQAAIGVQEEALGRMFDERSKQGLAQSVVVRRWGSANARLVARLQERQCVRVIDAGEARLASVVFKPSVELVAAEWSTEKPGWLDVKVRAVCEVSKQVRAAQLKFLCTTAGAVGETAFELASDEMREVRVQVQVPIDPFPSYVELQFAVSPPMITPSTKEIVLTSLTTHQIKVRADVPKLVLAGIISAGIENTGAATWHDATVWSAEVPVDVVLDVYQHPLIDLAGEMELRVIGDQGTEIVDGDEPFTIAGAGTHRHSMRLRTVVPHASNRPEPLTLQCTIRVERLPLQCVVQPAELTAVTQAAPPAAAVTTLKFAVQSVSSARWQDLLQATAAFETQVQVDVQGPLTGNPQIVLAAPPGVREIRLDPDRVRSGRQALRARIVYEVSDFEHPRRLRFTIQPPRSSGPVELRAPQPLEFEVAPPRPVRLAVAIGDTLTTRYEVDVDDVTRPTQLPVRLVPLQTDGSVGHGLSADVTVRGESSAEPTTLSTFKRAQIRLVPVDDASRPSFYRDTVRRFECVVTPRNASGAFVGGSQQIVLRQQAPLKRLLMWSAAALLAVAVVAVAARFAWSAYGQCSTSGLMKNG